MSLARALRACQEHAMPNERHDAAPAQAHFARSVLLALRARDTEALARLVVPAARDRILALVAASDSWAFLAASASDELQLRTDGTFTLAAFGEGDGMDVSVLRLRPAPDGQLRLEDVAQIPAGAFAKFGRPL